MGNFLYFEPAENFREEASRVAGAFPAGDYKTAMAALDRGPFDFIIVGYHDHSLDFFRQAARKIETSFVLYINDHAIFEEWSGRIASEQERQPGFPAVRVIGNSSHFDEIGILDAIGWAWSKFARTNPNRPLPRANLSSQNHG
jgi:hypothetical protein